jgi:alpha-tubulin suppressor-like RCC1 family protein
VARFLSGPGGVELENAFLTEMELVDRYVGNQLWAWGNNSLGPLGDGTRTNRSSPVQTIAGGTDWKMVSCGENFTYAIKTDGTLWTWGSNGSGQLGTGNITHRSSPVQTISGGTNWKDVGGGWIYAAAIKTDGTLWSWGSNAFGQLGDTTRTNRSSPVQTIAGGTDWKFLSVGQYHTVSVKTDGTLWSWGNNLGGRLGDGTVIHRSSPIQTIAGGNNWKLVSGGNRSTCAIKSDGTLWTWGFNDDGQLGDGTVIHRSSPIQTIAGGNNWKLVSGATRGHAAIKTDGTLWIWGHNGNGQLGDGTVIHRSSPVQTISGGTNWKSLSDGYTSSRLNAAIKTDGTLWVWGRGTLGGLGDNTILYRSSPVQTIAGGTNWKMVSCGEYYVVATTFTES